MDIKNAIVLVSNFLDNTNDVDAALIKAVETMRKINEIAQGEDSKNPAVKELWCTPLWEPTREHPQPRKS